MCLPRVIVLLLAAALLFGAGVPAAQARPAQSPLLSPAARKHKKKPKAVKCKKNQVPIKVNRRVVGCRSLGAAVLPPHADDSRLGLAQFALGDGLKGLRDRKGHKPQSVKKILGKVGPGAWDALQQTIPQGFARIDQRAAASPGVFARRGLAAARTVPQCA